MPRLVRLLVAVRSSEALTEADEVAVGERQIWAHATEHGVGLEFGFNEGDFLDGNLEGLRHNLVQLVERAVQRLPIILRIEFGDGFLPRR